MRISDFRITISAILLKRSALAALPEVLTVRPD